MFVLYILQNAAQKRKTKSVEESKFSIRMFLSRFSVAEIKLFTLFCYYWITTFLVIITVSLQEFTINRIMESIIALISCTAAGIRPECEVLKESLQEDLNYNLAFSWISRTFQALIPWFNLLLVIQVSDVKAVYKKIIQKLSFKTH